MSIFGKRKRQEEAQLEASITMVNLMVFGWELEKADGDDAVAVATRDRVMIANPGLFDAVHDTLAVMSRSGKDFSKDETLDEGLRVSGYIAARERLLGT